MKKVLGILALALLLPYSAQAGLIENAFMVQWHIGLTTSITPEFSMAPSSGVRFWLPVDKFMIGVEASAYSSQLGFDSALTGWGGAAYMKIRTFSVGREGLLHVLAKGGFQSEAGSWKVDFNSAQYDVGVALPIEVWGRSAGQGKGVAFEPGVSWMTADGKVSQVGVTAKAVLDF